MKNGITVSVIAVAVAIMFIAISIATVMGTRAMNSATYEEYMGKLKRIEDVVNLYINENDKLPTTGEVMSKEGASRNFLEEVTKNGDDNNKLYVINMEELNVSNVNIGYGTVENNDIFLVAENTNNIYYYKGMEYKGMIYYHFER